MVKGTGRGPVTVTFDKAKVSDCFRQHDFADLLFNSHGSIAAPLTCLLRLLGCRRVGRSAESAESHSWCLGERDI
jgi:hypothetical protein